MDFSVQGFDNLVGLSSSAANNGDKHKGYGSEFLKQEREEDFMEFKVAKTSSCDDPILKIPLQRSNSETHQQMLSFSSPYSQNMTLPYYLQTSAFLGRNTGYGYGATIEGVKSPFTPSQWMELEHQALIYKYITANVPIPSYLLNPIRKAFESAGFSNFPTLKSNSLAWGAFHLGFSNTDPEPGRCRRTDGKKWRCSRDAVVDQKYCERHMNRGRHRSRKPVEGHSGVGATTKKAAAVTASMGSSSSAGGASDATLGLSNNIKSIHPVCNGSSINRGYTSKENGNDVYRQTAFLSMATPELGLKDNTHDSIPKQHHNAYEDSSCSEFGLVCSDSLLNPMNKSSSLVHSQSFNSSDDHHRNKSQQNALRQFIDDWPRNQSLDRSSIPWPDLSISTPNEKLTNSPQRPSYELEMGLGMFATGDSQQKQTNKWVPISCEGPLGEVLHKNNNCSPALSSSSPRGVLQRGAFWSPLEPQHRE